MSVHINSQDEFKSQLQNAGEKLVIVDFFATWCGPCRNIAPQLETIAKENADSVVVLKVDVDEQPELSEKYGIQSLPTFLFIKSGNEVDKLVGANAQKLASMLAQHK